MKRLIGAEMYKIVILILLMVVITGCSPIKKTALPPQQKTDSISLIDRTDWLVVKSLIPKENDVL